MSTSKTLEDLEITLLLEAIYQRFGDDFRHYQKEIIRCKLHTFMIAHDVPTISSLQDRILHDDTYINPLLCALDANPSGLFDHPKHMRELRKTLIPLLCSSPAPKIWIAGCSAAEDVYAIAIMLVEEGIYHKTQIFATSANATLLNSAREAKFPLDKLALYDENYLRAGGTESLSDYFTQADGLAIFRPELHRNITWGQYNLGTDASFNEFELIVCRGSLNDYATRLRRRALQIFYDSLTTFGILSVADADYIGLTPIISAFNPLSAKHGLYQKIR